MNESAADVKLGFSKFWYFNGNFTPEVEI